MHFTKTNSKQRTHDDVNSNDKLVLQVCLLHPVFLSDVLSDVIGVKSNYSTGSALSNCQSNSS